MKLIVVFVFCISFSGLGQIPPIECVGDSLNVFRQEIISRGDTTTNVQTGWTKHKRRHGIWHSYYFLGSDTTKHFQNYFLYQNGRLVKRGRVFENGVTETVYNLRSEELEIVSRDNFGQVHFKMTYEYKGKNRRYVRQYTTNEQLKEEGEQRLMRITGGCDSGMLSFVDVGKWKYYDSDGNVEVREAKVKDWLYEEVRSGKRSRNSRNGRYLRM